MVELGAAVSDVEGTASVVLESELVSLDSNREDTINKHRLHSGDTTVRCILVGGALNRVERLRRVSASSISCGVRVVIPKNFLMSLQVVASVGNVTTVAAVASGHAIDELLSGEVLERTVQHDAVVGGHGRLSGEGPA